MGITDIRKEDLLSAIKGLNIKDFSVRDLEYLVDLFKIKSRQIEDEIRRRKRNGEN